MSAPGRPKGEFRRAKPAGIPVTWRVVKALSLMATCALMFACASPPPAEPEAEPFVAALAPVAPASPHPAFEQRQRERALSLARQGRLADAAVAWEVLTVLRPDVADYRERLDDVNRQIDAIVAERLPRASQAARRGELDAAMQLYLGVLAVEPDHARAADALRALERERIKRNYVGKYTRFTLTRRSISDGEMKSAPKLEERNELEHASMLAGQGDFGDAIALLERRLTANPREEATHRLLADLYFQRVQAQPGLDKATAIRWLERSVRLDPTHAAAKARLWQLKSGNATPRAAQAAAAAPPRPASAPVR
jgi:tetratricopeptide (TPR) repeat protein